VQSIGALKGHFNVAQANGLGQGALKGHFNSEQKRRLCLNHFFQIYIHAVFSTKGIDLELRIELPLQGKDI
jgi:hypothetical protein